ncbi:GTP cyclohydrolase I FolE2, partial [Halobacteriales archaeon SW_7_68_16]
MSEPLPDVQSSRPEVGVGLSQVGVSGVEKQVRLARNGDTEALTATFDAHVDLPARRKGADMSRNVEVIDAVLGDAVGDTPTRVEDICGDVAAALLERHAYTTSAEVHMRGTMTETGRTPATDRPTT